MGWLGKVQFHPSITHSSSSPTGSTNTFTHRQPNSQMHFLIFQFSSSETFTGQICWAGCIRNLFTYRNTENTSTFIIGFVAWPRSAHYLAERERVDTYTPCLWGGPRWGEREAHNFARRRWRAASERSCWAGGRHRWGYLLVLQITDHWVQYLTEWAQNEYRANPSWRCTSWYRFISCQREQ